jgi:alpha-tubulin suppressor-like RCC1 family protein
VTKIVQAGYFACALKSDGSIWCWGDDEFGQLGRGADVDAGTAPGISCYMAPCDPTPKETSIVPKPIRDLAVGNHHACVTYDAAPPFCWARNEQAQLGGGFFSKYEPYGVTVALTCR